MGREFDIPVTRSITEALTDGNKLAVEGVLLIGEHGNYPRNDKQQILYPRYEFMEEIVRVFRKTGQSVPVFNDKHLSYSWEKAKKMFDWSRELKFAFMAGSSLPVTWRAPNWNCRSVLPSRRDWSPLLDRWRSTGFTLWKRRSAWSNGGRVARRA